MSGHGGGGGAGGGGGGMLGGLFYKLGFLTDTTGLEKVEHLIEGVNHRLEFLGASEVIHGIMEMTEKFSSFAETLQASASAAGIGVESLQALQFAASQSAVGPEQMNTALGHLSRTLNAAREGGQEAMEAFTKLGITPDQVKSFKTSTQAFEALSDRMMTIQDPIKKTAAVMQLMGRGSQNLVLFMSKGSKAIKSLSAEASEMGAVLSEDNVHELAEVEDALSALAQVVKTFGASIAAAFAPNVRQAVKAILEFYKANRLVITANINEWVDNISYGFGYVFGVTKKITQIFLDFAASHQTLVRAAGNWLIKILGLSLGLMFLRGTVGKLISIFGLWGYALRPIIALLSLAFNGRGPIMAAIAMAAQKVGLAFSWIATAVVPRLAVAMSALGKALFASPLGAAVAALTALVLAAQAAYKVFYEGKPFSESWLGQAIATLRGMSTRALKLFGIETEDVQTMDPAAIGAKMGLVGLNGPVDNDGNLKGPSLMERGANMLSAPMQALAGASPMADAMMFGAGSEAAPSVTNTVNAPLTINVGPAGDAPSIAAAVKAGVDKHFGDVMRRTQRGLKTGKVF